MNERVITATAPVRVCDVGGWTDTWFAVTGAVFSVAVEPGAWARVTVRPDDDGPQIRLLALDVETCAYDFDLSALPGRQPLLEAALATVRQSAWPRLDVEVGAGVPPGCGTGTSAAVVVALLGALDRLTPGTTSPHELARAAHRVESEGLGQQSGVQDQLASAHGGINLFEVRHPDATVHPVEPSPATLAALQRRLTLVFLGHPHRSSAIHDQVIATLAATDGHTSELDALARLARSAATATAAGDLAALGQAMQANTEAQRSLHPDLVSDHAQAIIDAARTAGACGWKVNGAGGDGGSLTLLAAETGSAPLLTAVAAVAGPHEVVPTRLARLGLQVNDHR